MGQTGGKRFVDLHRPDAVRMLDFPHAAEHLHLLIEALQHAGVTLLSNALERSLHILKYRGPGLLLRGCDRLPAATMPGSSRPSAHHPWKRSPACRPKLTAKK